MRHYISYFFAAIHRQASRSVKRLLNHGCMLLRQWQVVHLCEVGLKVVVVVVVGRSRSSPLTGKTHNF